MGAFLHLRQAFSFFMPDMLLLWQCPSNATREQMSVMRSVIIPHMAHWMVSPLHILVVIAAA
jgi:hypothetical protein